MRLEIIQHVPFETPGLILEWALARGDIELHTSILSTGDPLPRAEEFDALILMGGPMSANDDHTLPWMKEEKRLIASVFEERKPLVGICLGAQLMASVLGARVYRAAEKEIGWFPITATAGGQSAGIPHSCTVFHWHGETFDLPAGATLLASTKVVPHQAFAYGGHALALQFHLEVTRENAEQMWTECAADITGGNFQQRPPELFGRDEYYRSGEGVLGQLLTRLFERPNLTQS